LNRVENADMGRFSVMLDMKGTIEKVPHGVTLIVGAWNYPIQLTLLPV
jgi:acyl-CoA reductase-like NAD-dependent aldehyde dehydrogenase